MAQTAQSAVEEWFAAIGVAPDYRTMHFWQGDGNPNAAYEINFDGGYIDRSHVKAFVRDNTTGVSHTVTLRFETASMIRVSEVVPATSTLCVYRDTPKNQPLALFVDGAILNAANLDRNAKQSVFAVAELLDGFDATNSMAEEAITRASQALAASQQAGIDAAAAKAAATAAQASATAAAGSASAAQTAAGNAASLAGTANNNAAHALDVANGIDAKATQALTQSAAAVTTANGIDGKATQAQQDAAQALATINNVASNALLDDGSKRYKSLVSKDKSATPIADGFTLSQLGSILSLKFANAVSSIIRFYSDAVRVTGVLQVTDVNDAIYQQLTTGGSINYASWSQVSNKRLGGSPRFEWHWEGTTAVMAYIDTNSSWHLAQSNGAGAVVANRMSVTSEGNIKSGFTGNTLYVTPGRAAFVGGTRAQMGIGDFYKLASFEFNTGGIGGVTYGLENYFGVLRQSAQQAGTSFILGCSDGLQWTKNWIFSATGEMYSPANSNNWKMEPNGYLKGTAYGTAMYIHQWCLNMFAPISDARVKDIVGPATKRALDYVEKVEFVEYDFKEEYKSLGGDHIDVGVTVQQLMDINPAFGKVAVTYKSDGTIADETLTLNTANLIAVLLKSVAELNAEVKELKNARA
ncbi:MAG: phage tail fiber protein [Aurantimicrobium sp.]|uniref:phage tail fiber domain-containing protein n=1 Tax=Bacillati TaxID=1783272 RepID=UPI002FCC6BA6